MLVTYMPNSAETDVYVQSQLQHAVKSKICILFRQRGSLFGRVIRLPQDILLSKFTADIAAFRSVRGLMQGSALVQFQTYSMSITL